jgi:hypothetical protein
MQASVKIVDWVPGSGRQARPALRLVSETLTAGELIAERVGAECRALAETERLELAEQRERVSAWLVVPGRLEQRLNGARVFGPGASAGKPLDTDAHVAIARKAFEARQFVMLFDGRQIETWDERITIRDDSLATFIRLTPLRGG